MEKITFRPFTYLRLSLTDRCNFRCRYCLPETHPDFHPLDTGLRLRDWEMLIPVLRELGIQKVRLTGGEPTLYSGLLPMLRLLSQVGFEETALTTNGLRLASLASELKTTGLTRVNVHIDSLRSSTFDRASQTEGLLATVLKGLREAKQQRLFPKVNVVLMRGENDEQVEDFIELAEKEEVEVRFIELMPTGTNGDFFERHFLSVSAVREALQKKYGLEAVASDALSGPARRYRLKGRKAVVGFIGSSCEGFCDGCQRLRLTSEGVLKRCLFEPGGLELKPLVARGVPTHELAEEIRRFLSEKWTFNPRVAGPVQEPFPLARIGG